ncbi:MAG: 3-dehydroquinate synthase [bacterium]|nr:3-dehydroquinate synthase [bacterium]
MSIVRVPLEDRSYSIRIEPGLLGEAGRLIAELGSWGRVAVISDRTVSGLFAKTLIGALQTAGLETSLFTVPDGETSKTPGQAERLYTELIRFGLSRDGLIVALGGGVVGDLAGFTAATFLRGIPFVQVPTTLLAQVDSSVGGKVGVNHSLGKNLIGCFHQPALVIIDPLTLDTLPMRERWSGAAEMVKAALIRDAAFFERLERELEDWMVLEDAGRLSEALAACCRIKADVVGRDERESGLRRILNFGHTLGHALESASGYGVFRHGEAVVYGMAWALDLSRSFGLLGEAVYQRADSVLRRFPLPPIPESVDAGRLVEHFTRDKKNKSDGLHLVLLNDIGRPVIRPVRDFDFTESIIRLLNRQIINL